MLINSNTSSSPVGTPLHGYSNETERQDSSLVQLACLLLRGRRLILALALTFGALIVALTLIAPKQYTTTVSFTPVASDPMAGGLAGIAGQLGVSIPGGDPAQSADFYAALLQTPDILTKLAGSRYTVADGRDTLRGSFIDLYEIHGSDAGRTTDEALHVLTGEVVGISFDRQTSLVEVSITTQWPDLSLQMAQRLLDLVNEFNLGSRQLQGQQEQRFLRERLDTATVELRSAENRLQGFLSRNRAYQGDPALMFEHDRLQRELNSRQDVYNLLVQSVEQARLRAVRNTPSISLVQHAMRPLRYDRRHTLPKLVGGLLGGAIAGVVWLLFRELLSQGRSSMPSDFETLERLWAESMGDVRGLFFLRRRSHKAA